MSQPVSHLFRVAFLGFSEFERSALASYFRLAAAREPQYALVQMLTDADFLVADADHGPSVQLVLATDRAKETVFIGTQAPPGAASWMRRPIDALHLMRELDAMVVANAEVLARLASDLGAASGWADIDPAPAPAPEPLVLRDVPGEVSRPPAPRDARPSLLERAAAVLPEAPPAAQPLPSHAAPPPPLAPRALVVDDSEVAQRYLQSRLEGFGIVVDRAASSVKASELMLRNSYDLVFADVDLGPESPLDGLELCRQIKQSAAAVNVAVVMVSAHHSELDRVRGALAGCDGYLAKPLDLAEFESLLLRQGLDLPNRPPRKKRRSSAAAAGAAQQTPSP